MSDDGDINVGASTSCGTAAAGTPPRKKKCYFTSFQADWAAKFPWARKERETEYDVYCKVCNMKFTVKYDGIKAMVRHESSQKHVNFSSAAKKSDTITAFFVKKGTPLEDKIAAVTVTNIYHSIVHNHSYNSFDCAMKLNAVCFSECDTAKKVRCGRTKAEIIARNVLKPFVIEQVLRDLNGELPLYFTLATDASNKGNRKFFPVVLFYFEKENGLTSKLVDFLEESDETARSVYTCLLESLQRLELDTSRIVSYSADNAPVNYGKNNSVYKFLKDKNNNIFKGNCHAHILHNCAKFACKKLNYDVEAFILKVYSEFSTASKKVSQLKEHFENAELEYVKILRHVPTRWLSLFACIERLLHSWPAIKSYFLQQGEENVSKIIWDFLKNQENEMLDDLSPEMTIQECYIYFVHHLMSIFNKYILLLERKKIMCTEIDGIMNKLLNDLTKRKEDKFFGYKVNNALQQLSTQLKNQAQNDFTSVYTRAIKYLSDWYSFDNPPFKKFGIFNLENKVNFPDLCAIANDLFKDREYINFDALYDEVSVLNDIIPEIDTNMSTEEKWCHIFKKCPVKSFENLYKIVQPVLSISVSNANVERIFSLMNQAWTDNRNKMSVDLVKSELCIKANIDMDCISFYNFISNKKTILEAVKNDKKYSFRH